MRAAKFVDLVKVLARVRPALRDVTDRLTAGAWPAMAVGVVFIAASSGTVRPALAQDAYPSRPIQLVVPFTPGGGSDIVARRLSIQLSEAMGQSVIVDNKPGAATQIGSALVAKSPPDGYRVLLSALPHVTNPSLFKSLPYDTVRDFAPVSLVARIPSVLLVSPRVPARTVKELVALSKSTQKGLNYGSPGQGTAPHLAMELLKLTSGLNATHVAYKGAGPQVTALLSGEIDVAFASMPTALAFIASGQLRALGIASLQRSKRLPTVPTLAEQGYPDFEASAWFALLAPANTPTPVIRRLNKELLAALNAPDVRDAFNAEGIETASSSPEELTRYINAEIQKWGTVIKRAGITSE